MKRIFLALAICLAGCQPPAEQSVVSHHVTLYQQGAKAAEWNTIGYVEQNGWGGAYYFTDAKTGEMVFITGALVIEKN